MNSDCVVFTGMSACNIPRVFYYLCDINKKPLCSLQINKLFCHTGFAMEDRPVEKSIHDKLKSRLNPVHLSILNESYMHNVPKGSESHFKVLVVSQAFENMPLLSVCIRVPYYLYDVLDRHRLVNSILEEELKNGVHALSIVAKTPSQWDENEAVNSSPKCLGGFGK